MKIDSRLLANWGNFPVVRAEIAEPQSVVEAAEYVRACPQVIARGNGRCYGDAALGPTVLSTLRLDRILAFDAAVGIVECEAGTLLADVLKMVVPKGWFFRVVPGTKFVTVGGAVASDVHGKNHPRAGCFSNALISIELVLADGQVLTCSRTENADLFWQTCGGMGWTGIVVSAKFRLRKIPSETMLQTTARAKNLDEIFRAFEANSGREYNAAWLDGLQTGANLGRGILQSSDHVEPRKTDSPSFLCREKPPRNVPFFAPNWLLNPVSIHLYNAFFWAKNAAGDREIDLETCFFPLDGLQNWNRIYGRRGLVQYQFCLPKTEAFDGIREVLEAVQMGRDRPFLSVLKRHGERPAEAVHSFPIRGFSLALDFPRTPTVLSLVRKLDEIVWRRGGKIYLTKDACSAPRMGRVNPSAFGEAKFFSLLKKRIS